MAHTTSESADSYEILQSTNAMLTESLHIAQAQLAELRLQIASERHGVAAEREQMVTERAGMERERACMVIKDVQCDVQKTKLSDLILEVYRYYFGPKSPTTPPSPTT
jgi:hypothetical protein